MFFFDLSCRDIFSEACCALRLIYHGDVDGCFGSTHASPINLDTTAAIRIKLAHITTKAIDPNYDYSLVFYRNDLSELIWNKKHRKNRPDLSRMTRQVKFTDDPDIKPHLLHPFTLRKDFPIYIAEYDEILPQDNYVPCQYVQTLHNNFKSFVMRHKHEHLVVTDLFESLGMTVSTKRKIGKPTSSSPSAIIFETDSWQHLLSD